MSSSALADADPTLTQVLGQYLAVQHPPLLPQLRLWLVAGHVDLNARCQELLDGGYAPYWAFCWASGQALARHILEHPELVRDKRVVDFGAGSGVVAIAALKAGAKSAVAVDTDARARQIAELNAALNGVALTTTERVPDAFDLLLASDVLYEPAAANALLALARHADDVLIADAHRQGTPRLDVAQLDIAQLDIAQLDIAQLDIAQLDIAPLCDVEARTFPDVDYPICRAFIYRLRGRVDGAAHRQ